MAAAAAFLAAAGPYLSAGSAILGGISSFAQSRQQGALADYNARVYEVEAQAARQNAVYESDRLRARLARFQGSQRAAAAGAGVTLVGGPTLAIGESAAEGEIDAQNILRAGSIAEQRALNQAALQRVQARSARSSGLFALGNSLLTGGSAMAQTFLSPAAAGGGNPFSLAQSAQSTAAATRGRTPF